LFVAYALFNIQYDDGVRSFNPSSLQTNIRALHDGLSTSAPRLPSGAHILLLHDPFAPETYDPLFTARLTYKDPLLLLDRGERKPGEGYDLVLDYLDNRRFDVPK
jgi:hypothetical protein